MLIKEINDYSDNEINIARQNYPAINKYLNILSNHNKNSLSKNIELKLERHKYWLQSSLAQVTNTNSTQEVCKYWSQKTIEIVRKAWDLIENNQNLALFALGKLGAFELNLSSDIDLIIVSEQPASKTDLKAYRNLSELLSSHDEYGFCYRLDFNLRPGGRLGPTICSLNQFEDYYWTQGATWERIALNRLLPICGNQNIIKHVTKVRNKFCYRKFIDYSLLNDIKNIRSHIVANSKDDSKINLKLNAGGIRDIELYVNSLQVIHGGKIPNLRTTETTLAISKLVESAVLQKKEADFLITTYWNYREIENHIQIKNDLQTHSLHPDTDLYKKFQDNLKFSEVNKAVSKLIGEKPTISPLLPPTIEKQLLMLNELGFNSELSQEIWPQLIRLTVLSKDNQIDEIYRSRFLYKFINDVNKYGLDKDLSLNLLYDFIKSIRPKKSFYHLLEREPNIIKELAIILSSSPYLGNLIAAKPEILDNFLLKKTQEFSNSIDSLLPQLQDFKQLNQLLTSSQFLVNKNIRSLTDSCSATADKINLQLLSCLKNKFPENSIDIIKLGKWGSHELGLLSDLDFIFVTHNDISDDDIKISRRFINMITNRQRGGEIYNIDMRLRPQSGTGAVISTKSKLIKYLINESQEWELQSYLKATPLIDTNFKSQIIDIIKTRNFKKEFQNNLIDIKNKVIKENYFDKNKGLNTVDLKYSPGALVDIEFSSQIKVLMDRTYSGESTTIDFLRITNAHSQLQRNYTKLRYYEQLYQILSQNNSTIIDFKSDSFLRFSTHLKSPRKDIQDFIINLLESNVQSLADLCKLTD